MIAGTDVDTSQAVTFAAFTDPVVYSRWLGVPVTLAGGRFACTMEWGTSVRGRYELVCPPELIVMTWDFEDDNVPVPGGEMTGYLRIQPHGHGAHVEVHQLVDTPAQAMFMEGAWTMVLGRLKAGVARASDSAEPMPLAPPAPSIPPAPPPEARAAPYFLIVASFWRYGLVDKQSTGHTFEFKQWTGLRQVPITNLFCDAAYLPLSGHDHEMHPGRGGWGSVRGGGAR